MRVRCLLCVILCATAALAPACAQGSGDEATDTLPALGAPGGGSGSACVGCPEGHVCSSGECVPTTADADGDGFAAKDDCDDRDPDVHPGVLELCNGKDDNCDGKIDEGFDDDGDGWVSCSIGTKDADCDDNDPLINPGAVEVCNGRDDNCDGKVDESFDKDGDGFYTCPRNGLPIDCDDDDSSVKPGASETCNGRDDDCDGKIDELPATLTGSLASPVNSHWALAGSATVNNSGWALLTPEQPYKAGALWWSASYLFDSFDVTGTFWMAQRADCADGIAFAFVPGTNVAAVGEAGYGYGVKGLGGYAVAIDTFSNPGEPPAPFLVVLNAASGAHLLRQSIPEVRNAQNHRLRVKLDAGKISVWLDSVSYVFDLPLPSYAPFTGRWGFTAGTGGQHCPHWVTDITMSFPNGQGCVP